MSSTVNSNHPYHKAAQEDRCAPRHGVSIAASLRPSGHHGFPVTVIDLSCAGFSCTIASSMRPGHRCWLSLPGLSAIEVEVVWNSGTAIGGSFASLLHPAVLDQVLERYSA